MARPDLNVPRAMGTVNSVVPLALVARPGLSLAGGWNSGTNAVVFAIAELLLLLMLCLRWLVRRQGGRRRAWRRLSREVGLTRRAFTQPVREFLRFRAEIRHLTGLLMSAESLTVAQEALDDIDTAMAASRGAFGFAVEVEPPSRRSSGKAVAHVSGRRLPAPRSPWEPDGGDHLWIATATDVMRQASERQQYETDVEIPVVPRVLVPVGLNDEAVVLVDLERGPGVLSVYGDTAASLSFVQAVAAYLDLSRSSVGEVLVARGVHPRHDGPDLDALLTSLEGLTAEPLRPVVVCASPDADQAAKLCGMAASGLLHAVVAGPVPGHRWEVRVSSRSQIQIAGLGLVADAAALGPAVARTARKGGMPQDVGGAAAPSDPYPSRPPSGGISTEPPPEPTAPEPFPSRTPAQPAVPPAPQVNQAYQGAQSGKYLPSPSYGMDKEQSRVAPEPLSPTLTIRFAEPEITGVSAMDASDRASSAGTSASEPGTTE